MSILGIRRYKVIKFVVIVIGMSVVIIFAIKRVLIFQSVPDKYRITSTSKLISRSESAKNNKIGLGNISTASALLLYHNQLTKMMQNGYIEVKTLNAGPVSYDNSEIPCYSGFLETIRDSPSWEPDTFEDFNHWLPEHKYYVGFGTWIGVTLFYATQFVKKAIGFEGDPVAFAIVQTNLNWNKNRTWYSHTHVYPVAVLQGSVQNSEGDIITMRSSTAGGSCSFVGDHKTKEWCGNVSTSWKIKGYTLPHLLNLTSIPASNETFIKIDVESYEWDLIPSWFIWLKNIRDKPTLRVSFHNNRRCGPRALFRKLIAVSKLYKGVRMDGNRTTLSMSFNLNNCFVRTLDFSDHVY